jgi:hypothetical protein
MSCPILFIISPLLVPVNGICTVQRVVALTAPILDYGERKGILVILEIFVNDGKNGVHVQLI